MSKVLIIIEDVPDDLNRVTIRVEGEPPIPVLSEANWQEELKAFTPSQKLLLDIVSSIRALYGDGVIPLPPSGGLN